MSRVRHVKPKSPRRLVWRCRDCKFHESNITKELVMALKIPQVTDPCDTNPNAIICYVGDNLYSFCFEPSVSKIIEGKAKK